MTSTGRKSGARRRPGIMTRLGALVESFLSSSRFLKWRTAVVGGWLVLTIASVVLVAFGGERNPIAADVHVTTAMGRHQVRVQNVGSEPWQDVSIVLPGGWTHESRTLRPNQHIQVSVTEFSRGERDAGETPEDFSPATVTVSTRAGTYVWDASRHR